jgi:hypothetical protein
LIPSIAALITQASLNIGRNPPVLFAAVIPIMAIIVVGIVRAITAVVVPTAPLMIRITSIRIPSAP